MISKYNKTNTREGYKIDNSIHLIGRVRAQINDFLVTELEKIGLTGIAPSHGDILGTLFENQELTMTEIAEMIDRDRSTVTTLVNKLKKLDYVDTKINPEDRRSNLVFLTSQGKELEPAFKIISNKLYETEYQGISEDEKKVFLKVLNKIYSNFI